MIAKPEAVQAVAANLCAAMSAYSRSSSAGRVFDVPGLTLVDSGLDFAAFNAAILPDCGSVDELERLANGAARYFRDASRPWGCWLCETAMPAPVVSAWEALSRRLRMRIVAEHTGMIASDMAPRMRLWPPLDIRPTVDSRVQSDFAVVCAQVFGLPLEVAHHVYGRPAYWKHPTVGWVGYANGRAVCCAATTASAAGVGLYSVGVTASYQGRGFGEAITRHAFDAAGGSAAGPLIVQSTPSGLGLYRRLGFAAVSKISVYMSS